MKQSVALYSSLSNKSKDFRQYRREMEKELSVNSLLNHYATDVCKGFSYVLNSRSGRRLENREILSPSRIKEKKERSASANKRREVDLTKKEFFTIINYEGKAK